MSVDQVDGVKAMQCPYFPHDAGEEENTGKGNPEGSRQREVTNPNRRNRRIVGSMSSGIQRLHGKYRIVDTGLGEPCEWFGDKTTTGIVVTRGIKRRER